MQNIDQPIKSQATLHTLPKQVSYGVYFGGNLETDDDVMMMCRAISLARFSVVYSIQSI